MAGQLTLPVPALRRPLPPLRQVFRLGAPGDIWHKPAVSAVVALAALNFVLLGAGRLDLSLYTSAGALVALYGHGLPYPARTRTLAAVALGTVASTAAALTASALTGSVTVLVAVAASLAAVHKVVCDATRIGPPAASSSRSRARAAPSSPSGSATSPSTSRSPRAVRRWPGWSAWRRP